MTDEISKFELSRLTVGCLICNKSVPVIFPKYSVVCEECKQAIKWAKAQMSHVEEESEQKEKPIIGIGVLD